MEMDNNLKYPLIRYAKKWSRKIIEQKRIFNYKLAGSKPWQKGYGEYRKKILHVVLNDENLRNSFRHYKLLPKGYGYRIDERIIEYPWVLSRLGASDRLLLDAGSALNYEYILDHETLIDRKIVIYTLSPEQVISRANISYLYGDLRSTILRSDCFDDIVCISTLEHIGMNNTLLYSKDPRYFETKKEDYLSTLKEFKRLLKPGGQLLITVPFGRYEDHGWFQQFDEHMIDNMLEEFAGSRSHVAYYRYFPEGWQIAEKDDCVQCSYYDIHHRSDYDPDYAAAARAVACIEIVR